VCAHELEGVVAKRRGGRYLPGERGWVKTKNRAYWRWDGARERDQLASTVFSSYGFV